MSRFRGVWVGESGNSPVDQTEQLLLKFFECRFGDPVGSRGGRLISGENRREHQMAVDGQQAVDVAG